MRDSGRASRARSGGRERALAALARALERSEASLDELAGFRAGGGLPHLTEHGRWQSALALATGRWAADGWQHGTWTGGLVAGQLWQAAQWRPSARLEAEARAIVELLAPRAYDGTTHDLGFLFWPSAVLGHLATGEARYRELALRAARTLAARLHPAGVLQA